MTTDWFDLDDASLNDYILHYSHMFAAECERTRNFIGRMTDYKQKIFMFYTI